MGAKQSNAVCVCSISSLIKNNGELALELERISLPHGAQLIRGLSKMCQSGGKNEEMNVLPPGFKQLLKQKRKSPFRAVFFLGGMSSF